MFDCQPIRFALADLPLGDRVALLNNLLAQLSADQLHVAVNDPESLGLVAEASLIGLDRSDELTRYLSAGAVSRMGALVSEALIARLPKRM